MKRSPESNSCRLYDPQLIIHMQDMANSPLSLDRIMGDASDHIKLTSGSVIEISRLPGYTLQTKGTR